MRKIIYFIFPFLVFIFPMLGQANGSWLTLNVPDSVGDQYDVGETGLVPDLVNMYFTFDCATGEYTIRLTASEVHPFNGSFRININLYNATKNSFFQDNMKDFALDFPTTVMTLTGTNAFLTSWEAGDQVYANNWDTESPGTPHPDGVTYFRSAVVLNPIPEEAFVLMSIPEGAFEEEDYVNLVGGSPTTIVSERPLGALPASQCLNLFESVTEKFSAKVRNNFDGCIIESSVIIYKSSDCTGTPITPSWNDPDPSFVYKSGTRRGCAEAVEVAKSSPVCVQLTLKSGRKTTVCY